MIVKKFTASGPLLQGHVLRLGSETSPSGGQVYEYVFIIQSDNVQVSLQANVTSGDLDVQVFTQGNITDSPDNARTEIITFPTISAPVDEMLMRKSASSMEVIIVRVTASDVAQFVVHAKAINNGETTIKITGATVAKNSGTTITAVPSLIIPVSLQDRNGVSILNNSTTDTLYVGFTSSLTIAAGILAGTPIPPGSSIGLDIAAGVTLYGISDGADIDVRLLEVG